MDKTWRVWRESTCTFASSNWYLLRCFCNMSKKDAGQPSEHLMCGQNLLLNFTEVHVDVISSGRFPSFPQQIPLMMVLQMMQTCFNDTLIPFSIRLLLQSLIVFLSGPLQSMFNSPPLHPALLVHLTAAVGPITCRIVAGWFKPQIVLSPSDQNAVCPILCFLWSCSSCMKGPSVQARRNAFMLTLSYLVAEVVF